MGREVPAYLSCMSDITDTAEIALSPAADARVTRIAEKHGKPAMLRLSVEGGGCAGFQYAFSLDDKHDDDTVMPQDGFDIVIDPMSSVYLMGMRVDYREDLSGAGFRFENPNATGTCGCGKSFTV